MLARDRFGYVHEIPDTRFSQAPQIVVDGLGNPVGQLGDFFDFLKPVVSAVTAPFTAPIQAVTQAASHLLPAVGQAVGQVLPAVGGLLNPLQTIGNIVGGLLPGQTRPPAPPPIAPPPPPYAPPPPSPFSFPIPPNYLMNPPQPIQFPPPVPLGWQRPVLPYTGPEPQRMYMRCSVWPGPAGLVPSTPPGPPGPLTPPTPQPGPPTYPGYPGWRGGGGRRFRRRHR